MDPVEEIKSRLEVSDVIGSYIQLKPAGTNHKGLCPFHHEKTPSFMASNEKGIWHCFGCGEGGDIFTFVEKMEGLDFRGALELLARRAGVTLPEAGSRGNSKEKERLYQILELATKYFQTALVKSKVAQAYIIKDRGFNKQAVESFRLGYAPPSASGGLVNWLRKRKFSGSEITKAGMARQTDGQLRDLFRGRFMLPFADGQGRIIGFTGRVLDEGMPKYLNTPQTLLFDKSRYVFGLFQAKQAIRTGKEAVLVEGNADVVTAHQFGFNNVVATSGTALTQWQLKALSRLAPTVKLAFDQDQAGLAATERAIPIAQTAGVVLYIVNLSGAKDPDELIRKDKAAWQKATAGASYVMDWLLTTLAKKLDARSATGKKQISDRFIASLARLSDPVEQDHYAQKLAELVAVDVAAIRRKLKQTNDGADVKPRVQKEAVYQAPTTHDDRRVVEDALLALAATYPDTRVALDELKPENFSTPQRGRLQQKLRATTTVFDPDKLPKPLKELSNYVKILILRGEQQYDSWAALDRRIEAFSLAQRLAGLQLKKTKQNLQTEIAAAEAAGNEPRRNQLLEQFRNLK